MVQTIQISSRVSVQGDLVAWLPNGEAVVRDGLMTYRGRPIMPIAASELAKARELRVLEGLDRI